MVKSIQHFEEKMNRLLRDSSKRGERGIIRMEELLKKLGIDENTDTEEIVEKLELKQSDIMERLDNVDNERRRQQLEDEMKQIEGAIAALSWMRGKKQTGIARDEDVISDDVGDLKNQGIEEGKETVQAGKKEEKTEKELYDEALAMIDTPDYAKGVEMMRRLAENGYAQAMYQMGELYSGGYRVQEDDNIAEEWYRKAAEQYRKEAEQGDADAQSEMGFLYYFGIGVAKDEVKAAEWYRRAAEQGNADAQYYLGSMYESGKGVAKDDVKAVEWYRKAAEQGYASAQINLGDMYDMGYGVEEDRAKAVEWYRRAARKGNIEALEVLKDLGESYQES